MVQLRLLLAALPLLQDPVAGLADLPVLDQPVPAFDGDWLVRAPTTRATVSRSADGRELTLDNGLVRRVWRLTPGCATVALEERTRGVSLVRAVQPEARVRLDGQDVAVGGLAGQPDHAFLLPEWLDGLVPPEGALHVTAVEVGPIEERLAWGRVRHAAPDAVWPPPGVHLALRFAGAPGSAGEGVEVVVHHELLDGLPVLSKWITVENHRDRPLELDAFACEFLAVAEDVSRVESRGVPYPAPSALHVETDFAMGGMSHVNANLRAVHWRTDPEYATQVNYERLAPCVLEVGPDLGPARTLQPGEAFDSFRAFLLVHDSTDRERRGLALRRMVRALAPWVTENPLMMHVRFADDATVRAAIDQCAEVGFEMVILTFGSGFDAEDPSDENLARWRDNARYAASRGVELGGYSLLSSRRVTPESDNCIDPRTGAPGAEIHGSCPALAGAWGQEYLARLRRFYAETGFRLLEHDGSYPGTPDAAARPPLQKGLADSVYVQWTELTRFYRDCRATGVYLNVPDWYFLAGSSKTGMGYRETNWSLPRDLQVLHARQNIYDGTWEKTPSMGWMFVPLTEYHGGGPAATIEPLAEHLDHYERMLAANLSAGVQACYRGPRLYDTDETRALVSRWVAWFREHRDLLESDVVHGRRPDGTEVDWMVHVNPRLADKAMLVVHNPLDHAVERRLTVPLHYAGLAGPTVRVADATPGSADPPLVLPLDPGERLTLDVHVPARGMRAFVVR